jgi:DNA-nicking Smr family endonuclease
MSFGDILNEWESVKREDRERKTASPKAAAELPPSSANEDFIAYMNRHGVADKDAGLDGEEDADKRRRSDSGRLRKMRPEASVDLHGLTETDAMRRLGIFLEDARRSGFRKVLIVHGKGMHSDAEPVLARAVARFLERWPAAGMSGKADKRDGGSGATWVVLKEGPY